MAILAPNGYREIKSFKYKYLFHIAADARNLPLSNNGQPKQQFRTPQRNIFLFFKQETAAETQLVLRAEPAGDVPCAIPVVQLEKRADLRIPFPACVKKTIG